MLPAFFLLAQITLVIQRFFFDLYKFQDFKNFCKEKQAFGILIGITLKLQITLGSIDILTICILQSVNMICLSIICILLFLLSVCFLGLHPWHMEVPRFGVESELQLLTYAIATAIPDLSCACDLPHSLWQCQIPNPLSKARDQTHILLNTRQICFSCTMMGTPVLLFLSSMFYAIQCIDLSPPQLNLFLNIVFL